MHGVEWYMTQDTLFDVPKKIRPQRKRTGCVEFYPSDVKTPEGIIKTMEEKFDRHNFYVFTSGGKDSVTLCNYMNEIGKLKQVVHIDTGIGLSMTTDFVRNYCKDMGWPYRVIKPRMEKIYASYVLQNGFPGPGGHTYIMRVLKFFAMREFALSVDRKGHCIITGVRKFESKRRISVPT